MLLKCNQNIAHEKRVMPIDMLIGWKDVPESKRSFSTRKKKLASEMKERVERKHGT